MQTTPQDSQTVLNVSIALLFAVLVAAFGWGTTQDPETETPPQVMPVPVSDAKPDTKDPTPTDWPAPKTSGAVILEFKPPTALDIELGGPGFYPPLKAAAANGQVPVPAKVDDMSLELVEVLAQSDEVGFWGHVRLADATVQLLPVADVSVLVTSRESPVANAEVRIALADVGFLSRTAKPQDGAYRVSRVPHGTYRLSVTAPGYLRETVHVDVPGPEVLIDLKRGAFVRGEVRHSGGAVANAIVVAHRQADIEVPVDVVTSDVFGKFSFESLPPGPIVFEAVADGYAPTRSPVVMVEDGATVNLELEKGYPAEVSVTDSGRLPVEGAVVRWAANNAGAVALTNSEGIATLLDVPRGAKLSATHAGIETAAVRFEPGTGRVALQLAQLERTIVRVLSQALVQNVAFHTEDEVCEARRKDERDWTIMGCAGKDGELRVETVSGFHIQKGALEQLEIAVEAPLQVQLKSNVDAVFTVTQLDQTVYEGSDTSIALLPGSYRFEATQNEAATSKEVKITNATTVSLDITKRKPLEFHVLDAQGAPVTGAWVGVLDANGVLIETKRSAGQLPIQVRVPEAFAGSVISIDPRRGWGRLKGKRIELSQTILGPGFPGGTMADLTAQFGPLVQDGNSVRFDADVKGSKIRRGNYVVGLFTLSDRKLLVGWGGKAYIEHVVR